MVKLNSDTIKLDGNNFELLFPFYIQCNSNLEIISIGKSLLKTIGNQSGSKLVDSFKFIRPHNLSINLESLKLYQNQVIIIEPLKHNCYKLRGQLIFSEENGQILFVGTPWVTSSEELGNHRLLITDFAISDPITDMIQVITSNQIVMSDIKSLIKILNDQKQDLLAASNRLKYLIQSMHKGVLVEDQNRKIVLVNQSFCDIFSIPGDPDEMVGIDCNDSAEQSMWLFKDPELFKSRIQKILVNRVNVIDEVIEMKSGVILERDYIPIINEGRYYGHLWIYRNITESKQIENKIRLSEEKYRSVIENLELGLLEVDNNDVIVHAYPQFCLLTGYTPEELIGTNALKLLHSDEDLVIMRENKQIRQNKLNSVYEVRIKKKDGTYFWAVISGAPILNDNDEIIGSIGIHWDVTSRIEKEEALKLAKEEAEKLSKIKQNFLANMSHEIRTPMNVILGLTNIVSESRLDQDQKEMIDVIKLSTKNLLSIVNDILDISKIESGRIEIRNASFNLHKELNNTIKFLYFNNQNPHLSLDVAIPKSFDITVSSDLFRIQQILTNLIGNAIKFTPSGKVSAEFRLDTIPNENSVMLEMKVSDTGIGISDDMIDKIFESFTQENRGKRSSMGGTGLGLAIVKELVNQLRGSIEVKSELNIGTTFHVKLPLKIMSDIEVEKTDQPNEFDYKGLRCLRILLVEDNNFNQLLIEKILSQYNCHLDMASNGNEAITLVNKYTYDIILMDIEMPGMDGFETTKFIRTNIDMSNFKTPIIALSARVLTGEIAKCKEAGMNDFISKPIDIKLLFNAMLKQLNLSKKYDLSYIQSLADGNIQFIHKLVKTFIDESISIHQSMSICFGKDLHEMGKLIHKAKSSINTIGGNRIVYLCSAMEETIKNGEHIDLLQCQFDAFSWELNILIVQLKNYLNYENESNNN